MATEPFRLRVVKALAEVIRGVTEDSNSADTDYAYDLSDAVFLGRNYFGDNDPLPMVSILEMPVAPDQIEPPQDSPLSSGEWDLLIQGFVRDDKQNPTDPAYRLSADVVAGLASELKRVSEAKRLTGKPGALLGILTENGEPAITGLKIGAPVCRPPDEVSSKAYFWLRVTIKITEDLSNPYAG